MYAAGSCSCSCNVVSCNINPQICQLPARLTPPRCPPYTYNTTCMPCLRPRPTAPTYFVSLQNLQISFRQHCETPHSTAAFSAFHTGAFPHLSHSIQFKSPLPRVAIPRIERPHSRASLLPSSRPPLTTTLQPTTSHSPGIYLFEDTMASTTELDHVKGVWQRMQGNSPIYGKPYSTRT